MKNKGLILFSGGLDSLLAARVLQEQAVELIGVHFLLPYETEIISRAREAIKKHADEISLSLRFVTCEKEYLEILRDPPHGYGKNCNPCIDCKILFQRLAKQIMHEESAAFIATGEVNGQRPMSQRRDIIRHIEKEAGTEGYILRPLSIRFFEPTHAENDGLIDREKLHSIHGRGRHVQLELAKKYDITDYATPAGGCLFTDPRYSDKFFHLKKRHPAFTHIQLQLLRIGRHFQINKSAWILLTRNFDEARIALQYTNHADLVAEPSFKGPFCLGFGYFDNNAMQTVADIIGRYSKKQTPENNTVIFTSRDAIQTSIIPHKTCEEDIARLRM